MRKLSFSLLWLFVFSLPWEDVTTSETITPSRVIGTAAAVIGLLTVAASGRVRRLNPVFLLASSFVVLNALSLIWTIAPLQTARRVWTYAQLLALVWLIWEFARLEREQLALMVAYVLGAFVSIAGVFLNYLSGEQVEIFRYAAFGFDPNDLGVTLALGIPMAWYLFFRRKQTVTTWIPLAYLPAAVLAILMTGSRGAFVAMSAGLLVVVWTFPRLSVRPRLLLLAFLAVCVYAAMVYVPEYSWARVFTVQSEMQEGTLTGRIRIWQVGFGEFLDHPFLGVGAGAFAAAVKPILGSEQSSHNAFLAVLVEQGISGFIVFAAMLGSCLILILRMPPLEKRMWMVLALTWTLGVMTLSWQYRKPTWLILGLLAAQAAAISRRTEAHAFRKLASSNGLAAI